MKFVGGQVLAILIGQIWMNDFNHVKNLSVGGNLVLELGDKLWNSLSGNGGYFRTRMRLIVGWYTAAGEALQSMPQ